MASELPSVSVGQMLLDAADPLGLRLELLAGRGGLDRRITIPYIQKTGLALAGFDEYLQPGRDDDRLGVDDDVEAGEGS